MEHFVTEEMRQLIDKYRERKNENLMKLTYEFVKDAFHPESGREDKLYRLEHSLRVALWGKKIAEGEGWDPEPIVIACLLHDIGYVESWKNDNYGAHHHYSRFIAEEYLEALGYDIEEVKKIGVAIVLHAESSPTENPELFKNASPFELSVWDADDLDRYDEMRMIMNARRDIGELTAADLKKVAENRLSLAVSSKDRICGTETARKYWLEEMDEGRRLYEKLIAQMDHTWEMEQWLSGQDRT